MKVFFNEVHIICSRRKPTVCKHIVIENTVILDNRQHFLQQLVLFYLLKLTPNQLQENPPVLESTVFVEGFKDWSGSVTNAGSDLLVTLRSPADSGGVNILLLLKNADNASGN